MAAALDLSQFLRDNFAAPKTQAAVLPGPPTMDAEIETYLACHHKDYKLRKDKKKQQRQEMYSSAPAGSQRPPAIAAPTPVHLRTASTVSGDSSIDDVIALMTGARVSAGGRTANSSASSSPSGTIAPLKDGQRLNLYSSQ